MFYDLVWGLKGVFRLKKYICYGISVVVFILGISLLFIYSFASDKVVVKDSRIVDVSKIEDSLTMNNVMGLKEYYGNLDIKGILSIDNNRYPVAQATDNDYYLTHNYFKEYDKYGAIMADYRVDLDNSKKVLIFGHSSVKEDVPFNRLENYYDEDYFKEYPTIKLETENNYYNYEIFSVYVETSDFTYMNMNFNNEEDWYRHILKLQSKSMFSTDIVLSKDDDILILQTCSNHPDFKDYDKKYLLIVARKIK